MGLTPDDAAAMKDIHTDDSIERISQVQDENKAQLAAAGIDTDSLTLEVGKHCEWIDVVQMVQGGKHE
jgi:hypothetical protein